MQKSVCFFVFTGLLLVPLSGVVKAKSKYKKRFERAEQPLQAGYCSDVENGYCTQMLIEYELKTSEKNPVLFVNCALRYKLVVQLPQSESLLGKPVLGDTKMFQLSVDRDLNQVTVWPTAKGMLDRKSNVHLKLESGINILINLRTSSPESAVQHIKFSFPERENEQSRAQKLESAIIKRVELKYRQRFNDLDAEAHRRSLSLMAKSILNRVQCVDLGERKMIGLLELRVSNLCQLGNYVYIKFEIHNRARDLFTLGNLEVFGVNSERVPLDPIVEWEGDDIPQLRYDQKRKGVAVFPVTDEQSAREYILKVSESAGKKRVVVLEDLKF